MGGSMLLVWAGASGNAGSEPLADRGGKSGSICTALTGWNSEVAGNWEVAPRRPGGLGGTGLLGSAGIDGKGLAPGCASNWPGPPRRTGGMAGPAMALPDPIGFAPAVGGIIMPGGGAPIALWF